MKSVYTESTVGQLERLLSNMDRNKDSPTYGCLCRPYWHDKVMDFPSAHQQIGVLPLSIAYSTEFEDNKYYGSESLKEWIEAGIRFWGEMQKRNGSFDEHYPNEHSMGATAWTLWAITESYLLLEDPPDIESEILKAVEFLERYDEPGDIANHQAVAASALINSYRITGRGIKEARKRLETLEEMQHEEGWFQEYVGVDIGYQSTTISHLGRLWSFDEDLVDTEMLEKSLNFFSNFIDRENYYAGIIGSRNTSHIHAAGFEILAGDFSESARIVASIRRNKEEGRLLHPYQMDDKHFSRQLAEYLDAYRHASSVPEKFTEVREKDYEPISVVKPSADTKIFLNKSKGGVYKKYSKGELVEKDRGVASKSGQDVYTSNWPGATEKVTRADEDIVLEGRMRKVPRNNLPRYYFLLSRFFNYSFGRFPSLSLRAKRFLISKLIGERKTDKKFCRKINLEEGIEAEDAFDGERIFGKTRTNFVPSSEFFRG